jgi:hypothetical protein
MSERAQVRSVEAIASFRAKLIVFMTKTRTDVEEVSDEVQRVRVWLESDRRAHWDQEFRKRTLALQELQQQFFSARISHLRSETAAQALAVERAKRAVRDADEKRADVRRWSREYENRVQPLAKQIDQLLTFLSTDLTKAVAYLATILGILESYAGPRAGAAPSPVTLSDPVDKPDSSDQSDPTDASPTLP